MTPAPGLVIRQAARATFRSLVAAEPALIAVVQGVKRVSGGGTGLQLGPGCLALLPDNQPLTIENIPDGDRPYMARAVVLGRANVEAAYRAAPPAGIRPPLGPVAIQAPGPALDECFNRLCAELTAGTPLPEPILDLRRQELVMRLAEAGAILGAASPTGLSARLRAMITADPAAAWSTGGAASALAMSEATLRRRLAGEATTFQDLLADTRMTHALGLLQSTGWTVAAIAQQCGYESPSRFAARFRERFGLAPAEIRQSWRDIDRNGAKMDRSGRAAADA